MAFELPQELWDEILDNLAGHRQALMACSLVCRSWVPRSRTHLFETIALKPRNIQALAQLLRLPEKCTFFPHVSSIVASRYSWNENNTYFNSISDRLKHFSSVRSLTLRMTVDITHYTVQDFHSGFISSFPTITTLVLYCEFSGKPAPLADMISLFPSLQRLEIRAMSECRFSVASRFSVPPPDIRHLYLFKYSAAPILSWLHSLNLLHTIETLSLIQFSYADAPILRKSLAQIGGSLQHLKISMPWAHSLPCMF